MITLEEKRHMAIPGAGRPKKKKVQWKPAKLLDTIANLDETTYHYRWVDKDPANLMKKQAEGWEFTNTIKGDKVEHERPDNLVDGGSLTPSLTEYRELILMRIPNEQAEARKTYYDNMTESQIDDLETSVDDNVRRIGGRVHGGIRDMARVIE